MLQKLTTYYYTCFSLPYLLNIICEKKNCFEEVYIVTYIIEFVYYEEEEEEEENRENARVSKRIICV